MDHLNIFNPYENKPQDHEDQISRALLILLKNSKAAELAFTDLLIGEMRRLGCQPLPNRLTEGIAGIDQLKTQVWSTTKNNLTNLEGRLVSVLITDHRLQVRHRVERTDRVGVYDGIVHYKPDWIFVIENKPDHKNVWFNQLSSSFSDTFEIEPKAVVLRWQDILTSISTARENALLAGAEDGIAEDFLDFVSERFPELNPYDSFGLCRGNLGLLERRCVAIMEESKLGSVDYHRGWHHFIGLSSIEGAREIALYPSKSGEADWKAQLDLFPGDTIRQAREFYSKVAVERVVHLKESGWEVKPNFHFAFRSSNLVPTSVDCELSDYLGLWVSEVRQGRLRQIPRTEWDTYFGFLEDKGMLASADKVQLKKKIIDTKMDRINICPGVRFTYTWSQADAVNLDAKNLFVKDFTTKVADCLDAWCQTP